jgi:hypothetical protein
VRVFNGDGLDEKFSFYAYDAGFTGGVRVAMGDVTGDGTPDVVTAAGPGGGPHVRVFDGVTGEQVPGPIGSFYAYDARFNGGVFVAAADLDRDGLADIVTGAGAGGGPHVRVFSGADGSELLGFFDQFKGGNGVRVATGDIDGDGRPDIITGSGSGVHATVRVFSGAAGRFMEGPIGNITPYRGFAGGVYVAAGDVDGDGRDDVITGAGAGGGPHVKVFSGVDGSQIASFYAYHAGFRGGVRVSVGDVDNNGSLDIITGAGPGGGPHVRAFTLPGGGEAASFYGFAAAFGGGVFVAGAAGVAVSEAGSMAASAPEVEESQHVASDVANSVVAQTPELLASEEALLLVAIPPSRGADAFFAADEEMADLLSLDAEEEVARPVADDATWELALIELEELTEDLVW